MFRQAVKDESTSLAANISRHWNCFAIDQDAEESSIRRQAIVHSLFGRSPIDEDIWFQKSMKHETDCDEADGIVPQNAGNVLAWP